MPHLSEEEFPQSKLIADINAGTSFVKDKPDNIGELIYFDTTNPQAESLGDKTYRRNKAIDLLASVFVIAGIWLLLYTHIGYSSRYSSLNIWIA